MILNPDQQVTFIAYCDLKADTLECEARMADDPKRRAARGRLTDSLALAYQMVADDLRRHGGEDL